MNSVNRQTEQTINQSNHRSSSQLALVSSIPILFDSTFDSSSLQQKHSTTGTLFFIVYMDVTVSNELRVISLVDNYLRRDFPIRYFFTLITISPLILLFECCLQWSRAVLQAYYLIYYTNINVVVFLFCIFLDLNDPSSGFKEGLFKES